MQKDQNPKARIYSVVRTVQEEHRMARHSVLVLLNVEDGIQLSDVRRKTGLCEIRAALALKQLVEMKKVVKSKKNYFIKS